MKQLTGFEHDAERNDGRVCLSLKGYFVDMLLKQLRKKLGREPTTEEKLGTLEELHSMENAVYERREPCPLAATCKRYKRAVEQGKLPPLESLQRGGYQLRFDFGDHHGNY